MSRSDWAKTIIGRLAGIDPVTKIERRAARLGTNALVDWLEPTVVGVGKAINDWSREGRPDSLDEARVGTASLLIVLEELAHRRDTDRL